MPVLGGEEQKVLDTPAGALWHVTGNSIFLVGNDDLHRFALATGKDSVALKLPPGTARGASNIGVTSDGRWVVFVHVGSRCLSGQRSPSVLASSGQLTISSLQPRNRIVQVKTKDRSAYPIRPYRRELAPKVASYLAMRS